MKGLLSSLAEVTQVVDKIGKRAKGDNDIKVAGIFDREQWRARYTLRNAKYLKMGSVGLDVRANRREGVWQFMQCSQTPVAYLLFS